MDTVTVPDLTTDSVESTSTDKTANESNSRVMQVIPTIENSHFPSQLIICMASSLSVNGEVHAGGLRQLEFQQHENGLSILIKEIAPQGPFAVLFQGNPSGNIPLRGDVIQRGFHVDKTIYLSPSPGFLETFTADGKQLVSVENVRLVDGDVRRQRWEFRDCSAPMRSLYASHAGRLIWHVGKYDDPHRRVLCLDKHSDPLWLSLREVDVVSIHVNSALIVFLVAPALSPFYSFYITDVRNGEVLRVLELSRYNVREYDLPKVALTEKHLFFTTSRSPGGVAKREIFMYNLDDLIDGDEEDDDEPRVFRVPDIVSGSITQIQTSADGVYLAGLTTYAVEGSVNTEVSLILWNLRLKDEPQIRTVVEKVGGRNEDIQAGLWYVVRYGQQVEISFITAGT
jgi:hypothetical protein